MTKYRIYQHEADGEYHIYKKVLFWWENTHFSRATLWEAKNFIAKLEKFNSKKKDFIEEIEIA